MLNIPESVKTLFKADGIRKNFRVQFPNGEMADLTNDDVVQESAKFTESICSQDVLKFGLTEASVIEFETVGVGNMYGMTISCGIEIDLSSLSAAEIAEIAAGSWDGVYVSESDADIGFPFFRVPYGVFRVESCPRDHQAMTHRRVQAYAKVITDLLKNSPFEIAKQNAGHFPLEAYTADAVKILYSSYIWTDESKLVGLTQTDITPWTTWPPTLATVSGAEYSVVDGLGFSITRARRTATSTFGTGGTFPSASLYTLSFNNGLIIDADLETIRGQMEAESIPESMINSLLSFLRSRFPAQMFYNTINTSLSFEHPDSGIPVFYPQAPTPNVLQLRIYQYMEITISAVFSLNGSIQTRTINATLTLLNEKPTLKQITGLPDAIPISIQNTGKNGDYYNYINSLNFAEFLGSFLELHAKFATTNRQNEYEELQLDNGSPMALSPQLYSGFWWDEYDVLPIGAVVYSYNSNGENVTGLYQFGPGPSVYDMSDNLILQSLASANESTVTALLDTHFIPFLSPVAFTPIDLSMKGLPYLKAGDYLAVTAEDGTIAYSFAMRQEIQGIQVLTAEIESTSGEIIDSGEGTT